VTYNNIIQKNGIICLKLKPSSVTDILTYNRCEILIEKEVKYFKNKKLKINIEEALAIYELERYITYYVY